MPITFEPLRIYLRENNKTYYYLANNGIDAQTIQRIRHNEPITTTTIEKICSILGCQPVNIIAYIAPNKDGDPA